MKSGNLYLTIKLSDSYIVDTRKKERRKKVNFIYERYDRRLTNRRRNCVIDIML